LLRKHIVIKADIAEIKTDVASLKADVTDLKVEFGGKLYLILSKLQ
jgi:hypothetical protein